MVVSKLISFKSYEKPVVGIEGKVTRGAGWWLGWARTPPCGCMHLIQTLDTLACTDTHLDTHHAALQALESGIKVYVS